MNKFFIRRFIFLISLIFLIIFPSLFIANKFYVNQKCKDLYFATEYLSTKGDIENSFLTIKNFDLKFLDKDIAILNIQGLTYEKPHKSTNALAYFKKNRNNIWSLEKIERLT